MSTWITCTRNFAFRDSQSVLQMSGLPWQFRHGMLIEYQVQQTDDYFRMSICHLDHFLYLGARRGEQNELMRTNNQVMAVDPTLVPESGDAIQQFESHGG